MLKLLLQNATALQDGIALLTEDLHVTVVDKDADVTVEICEVETDGLCVSLQGDRASITYGGGKARFFRGLATLVGWLDDGITEQTERLTPSFSLNGSMVDVSRNAVMNLPTVKLMMRKMALMGMNAFLLYTEDTYEIVERPYFGYMRGRYTKDELRELDAYALALGIELIPCIQTLGHLDTALRWSATAPYKDTPDVMRVGAEETYRVIEDMIRTVADTFTTKRIHIGMDETHSLGTGNSLDQDGYRPREELFFEHLNRVAKIAEKYGLQPMMWSDMFFRLAGKGLEDLRDYDPRIVLPDGIADNLPKNVQQVFWDYYRPDEAFYSINIENHRKLGDHTLFAGGIWMWSGHCPLFSHSIANTVPALRACRKHGVREVLATIWHNAESSLIISLALLALYADCDYRGDYDAESTARCFRYATGECYEDFLKLELPEHPDDAVIACTRALLYNDPLLGLVDKNVERLGDTAAYYTKVLGELSPLGEDYAPAFRTVRALTDLLVNKADFGVRLTRAYRANDREALAAMAAECDTVIQKIDALRAEHRASWMAYNKPFGWEVHDVRYGGLRARFETVKGSITDYLAGTLCTIEELEAERLRFDCLPEDAAPFGKQFFWYSYSRYVTAGRL